MGYQGLAFFAPITRIVVPKQAAYKAFPDARCRLEFSALEEAEEALEFCRKAY